MIHLDRAACRDADAAVFWADSDEALAMAKSICARCEVRLDCLALALSTPDLDGVWGGLSAREREPFAAEHRLGRLG